MEIQLPVVTFDFETVCTDETGSELQRDYRQAQCFQEPLDGGASIDMVMIPSGTVRLGSPVTEEKRLSSEDEPHWSTFDAFCMSKYPITQAQWRAVAHLPKISLDLDPEPSGFKGLNRPVEQISWYDAVEFCNRLALRSQRIYRLPTEAEWEYACRARTETPFCYGKTLTTELANYCGEDCQTQDDGTLQPITYFGSYGQGTTGVAREQTIAVGSLNVANDFGLYDMHGNVREWCSKDLQTEAEGDDAYYLQPARGGSWQDSPAACRSTFSLTIAARTRCASTGFRVVHTAATNPNNPTVPASLGVTQSVLSNIYVGGNLTVGNINLGANQIKKN